MFRLHVEFRPLKTKISKPLVKGQIWKLDDRHVQIVHIGKLLAQYRETRTLKQRGAPVQFKQIAVLQEFLFKQKAELLNPEVVVKS
jgi:predicted metal-dependent phosphotriesterase family hydrolase